MNVATLRLRTIPLLTVICGALFAAYVALMIATILFASLETQLAQNVQDKRMAIAKLETSYYDSVAKLDASNPQALGYVTPSHVDYVSQAQLPGFAFAR